AKIFACGVLPKGRNRRGSVEIYDRGRFFAVTGLRLRDVPATPEERQSLVEQLQRDLSQDTRYFLSDGELIERAKTAQNGDKFSRLWSGDRSGYRSDSEAEQALCNLLAFWIGPNSEDRIDRLFRQSGLYRDKWERKTYRDLTIGKALSRFAKVFTR